MGQRIAAGSILVLLDRCCACKPSVRCRWCEMHERTHASSWSRFALCGGPETAAAEDLLWDTGWALAVSLDFQRCLFAEGAGPLHLTNL